MKEDIQFFSTEEIFAYQSQALRDELCYMARHSPYYKRVFAEANICIEDIKDLNDLKKLPFTTKTDLQKYNEDFIAVDKSEIRDFVATSGTLGDAVSFALSDADLDRLAKNEKQSFQIAGLDGSDTIQLMTTIDKRFMAGMAYFLGSRLLGCSMLRVGNGVPELQWDTINRIRPTAAIVVPSFIVKLIDFAKAKGIDYKNSSLKKAICIGESIRNIDGSFTTLGAIIHKEWEELELFSTYASTEMQTSTTECVMHNYSHTQPDLIIIELLDEDNNEVADGQLGEVTITTLGVKAMPLLRFKTGDLCVANRAKCECGRNSMRLSSIRGRKAHMLKYKGTTLYPSILYDILDNVRDVKNYIIEAYTGKLGTDEILVRIASERKDEAFVKELKDLFRAKIRVSPQISFESNEYIEERQMPAKTRKLSKFIDLREKH